MAHFVGRLGTMPTRADFGEFSGKQDTHGADQNKTRDEPDDVSRRWAYSEPGGAEYLKRLAQGIDQHFEIGRRPTQGIGIAAMFDDQRTNWGD